MLSGKDAKEEITLRKSTERLFSGRILNQSAKRNKKRFPPEFMFQLCDMNLISLMSVFAFTYPEMLQTKTHADMLTPYMTPCYYLNRSYLH